LSGGADPDQEPAKRSGFDQIQILDPVGNPNGSAVPVRYILGLIWIRTKIKTILAVLKNELPKE